jgi:hypothetical protein
MPKCKVCDRSINTKKDTHYKFGKDYICYIEATEDCITTYVGWKRVERENEFASDWILI